MDANDRVPVCDDPMTKLFCQACYGYHGRNPVSHQTHRIHCPNCHHECSQLLLEIDYGAPFPEENR